MAPTQPVVTFVKGTNGTVSWVDKVVTMPDGSIQVQSFTQSQINQMITNLQTGYNSNLAQLQSMLNLLNPPVSASVSK